MIICLSRCSCDGGIDSEIEGMKVILIMAEEHHHGAEHVVVVVVVVFERGPSFCVYKLP